MGSEYNTDHENLVDDLDAARASNRQHLERIRQLEEELKRERNDGPDKRLERRVAELEREVETWKRHCDWLKQDHERQVKAHLEQIQKNAEKVGEAISLRVQFDALRHEHAKCGGPVSDRRLKELQEELRLHGLAVDELKRELKQAHDLCDARDLEIEDLKASLESLNEEAADEEDVDEDDDRIFTLDDIRDVVREELRADRRRRS